MNRKIDGPIFDAHIHYKSPAWNEYPVSSIIELMDKSGVAMGLVSSSPDEATLTQFNGQTCIWWQVSV